MHKRSIDHCIEVAHGKELSKIEIKWISLELFKNIGSHCRIESLILAKFFKQKN